jgi:micrococcal nuclease
LLGCVKNDEQIGLRVMIIVPDDPGPALPDEFLKANVVKVFDGDGFLANVWHTLREAWVPRVPFRFAFIDAPEIEQPFGRESQAFLQSLIGGKTLRLDPIGKESTGGIPIDPYKRLLCMGFLTEQMEIGTINYYLDGACNTGKVTTARPATRNIELEMIVNGWAWVVERWTFEREDEYFAAQEDAQRNRRGLWVMDNPEPPWDFKRRQRCRKPDDNVQGKLL